MGKGSGGTRGSSWRDKESSIDFKQGYNGLPEGITQVNDSAITTNIGRNRLKELVVQLGSTENDFESAMNLIQDHSNGYGGQESQSKVDEQIYQLINDRNSSIGKALRNIAKVNEAQYENWVKVQKNNLKLAETKPLDTFGQEALDYYNHTELNGYSHKKAMKMIIEDRKFNIKTDIPVYRGGGRKNAESWTEDSRGANIGNGIRIRPTMKSSVNEMRKTHYILGGISQMVGASGEAEIFFVKKKR